MKIKLSLIIFSILIIACQNTTKKKLKMMSEINKKMELSNEEIQCKVDELCNKFEASFKERPVASKPYYTRSKVYSSKCDSLYEKILQVKDSLLKGIDDVTLKTYKKRVRETLDEETILGLYCYIKSLKQELLIEQKKYGKYEENFFNHILSIVEISENDFIMQFNVNSVAEALIILSGIENDIKRVNSSILSLFYTNIGGCDFKFNPISGLGNFALDKNGETCAITTADYNRNSFEYLKENDFLNPLNEPLTTFSVDVDVASYSLVRRHLMDGLIPPQGAVRIEEMINYFDYNYPPPGDKYPFTVYNEFSECPWNKKNELLLIGLQGKKIDVENLPVANLVFLIDVSGSMQAYNKLPLLKESMELLVSTLRPEDKVAIAVYAGNAGLILPATPVKHKGKIMTAINNLEAGGSTAGGEGIKLAYNICSQNYIKNGNNRIILATDGDFNVGVSSDSELVRLIEQKRKSNIYLSVLGFGFGNFQDAKMEKLSNAGNGNYAYIDNIKEAKKVLVNEIGGTLYTIAKDVKLQLEFNPLFVKSYRLIGYENRVLQSHEFNDDSVDAGEIGAGHSVTALYELELQNPDTSANMQNLKYQNISLSTAAKSSNELATLKIRYKLPDNNNSKLKAIIIPNEENKKQSDNFRLACSVAEFGLLLRKSKYKGTSNAKNAKSRLQSIKIKDRNGYRKELIDLMGIYEGIRTN